MNSDAENDAMEDAFAQHSVVILNEWVRLVCRLLRAKREKSMCQCGHTRPRPVRLGAFRPKMFF